jgi:predicted MPP superfamily phosphohydrolase
MFNFVWDLYMTTNRLTADRLPVLALLILPLGALLAGRAWSPPVIPQRFGLPGALLMLGFGLADAVLLASLSRLGLSFGQVELPFLAITLLRTALTLAVAILLGRLLGNWTAQHPALLRGSLAGLYVVQLGIFAAAAQGMLIEPFRLGVSTLPITAPDFLPGRPLRILQLADLHVERLTRREAEVLAAVEALQPDLIVLTGDYVNVDYRADPLTWQQTREMLSQLDAPLGVYAVPGTPGVDIPTSLQAIFHGLDIVLLQDQLIRLELEGAGLYIVGVSNLDRQRDAAALQTLMAQVPPEAYSLLLYHTPDLAEAAAAQNVDLYLAGHTHGGQIRLPFYGALVTLSAYGKRFEMGQYQVGPTTLYVSRGIGMEGLGLPRARFLCPPEIVLFELSKEFEP